MWVCRPKRTDRYPNKMERISRTSRCGFTLVEVLVVVVIIAISGAVVVPLMLRGGQLGLQAAVRAVIADMLYAQNDAVAYQTVRQVVFESQGNRYRITDGAGTTVGVNWKGGAETGQNYVVELDQNMRFQGVVLENIDFGGTTTLAFDELGSPVSGGTLELTTGDFRYRVTVAPFTGQVTVASVSGD